MKNSMIIRFLTFFWVIRGSKNFIKDQKEQFAKQFKGAALAAISEVADEGSIDTVLICQWLKQGEKEKLVNVTKEINKHVNEANKVRISFMTALGEGLKPDSKMTIPDVLWSVLPFKYQIIIYYKLFS